MKFDKTSRVDMSRYAATLVRSSGIGVGKENGLSRLALTDADKEMRDVFVEWCFEAGLQVRIDSVGNIFARRKGAENLAPVLIGSHLDTQANGGCFDGIVGVLGGLEVIRNLNEHSVITKRPIEIVNWSNEEGARFAPPMVASGCYVGAYSVEWVHSRISDDGATYGQELDRIGYMGEHAPGGDIDSYFELHVEQGDALEKARKEIGVVTHGHTSFGMSIRFTGETAHSGTCPMGKRKNALVAAVRFLTAVDDIGWEYSGSGGKATAARLVAWPNKTGSLSEWAEVIADVRHDDPRLANEMQEKILAALSLSAEKASCEVQLLDHWTWGGDIFDKELVGAVRQCSSALNYSSLDLPSQAGHDAYFIAKKYPAAMIFVPSRGGVSHNNNEYTALKDIEPGLNVLLHVVAEKAVIL